MRRLRARVRRLLRLGRIAPWWRRFKANGYRVDRCAECGHRFRWSMDPRHANGNRDGKHYHGPCLSNVTWRRKAEDRLTVLDLALYTTHTTPKDLRDLASLQYSDLDHDVRAIGNNRVWSVLYDLEKRSGTSEAAL
ncbi:MAG TPA: hypothetical protein VGE38_07080 [Nocardioides sp.]|uniref:hypothetical protein n=1 Tax=Nocardioides sp. TaxID=35761 RepID=UPI002ED7801B